MFKLNFLIIITNGLIERNTTTYLIRDILDYDIELDNCAAYNWGELLIRSPVKKKSNWENMKSLYYPGAIVFLTVSTLYLYHIYSIMHIWLYLLYTNKWLWIFYFFQIFYIDRVMINDYQHVQRYSQHLEDGRNNC